MPKILVVDDEESYRDTLTYQLSRSGFDVVTAASGDQALERFDDSIDVVLLDIMLPGTSGTRVGQLIRQRCDVPIIMVTAKDSEVDKVVGLELGADDYVTKPYSFRELLARIRVVLRRRSAPQGQDAAGSDNNGGLGGHQGGGQVNHAIAVGGVSLDSQAHMVWVDGQEVALPLKEFDLLELLMRNEGRVLTRGQIIDRVWGHGYSGDSKTLDVHIKRLRAKIEATPATPRYILTVRGLGYKMVAGQG